MFGPNRPVDAIRAISELHEAELALSAFAWPQGADYESAVSRVREARNMREQYPEYGDTFRGH